MSWQSDRENWNKIGLCAREICMQPFKNDRWVNKGNNLSYCRACAKMINFYTPDLVEKANDTN